VQIPLDTEETKQFCEEQGVANDGKARVTWLPAKPQERPVTLALLPHILCARESVAKTIGFASE